MYFKLLIHNYKRMLEKYSNFWSFVKTHFVRYKLIYVQSKFIVYNTKYMNMYKIIFSK